MSARAHLANQSRAAAAPSIARNTAWLVWSGAVNIANGVVLWVAMAHWRPTAEVGQFSTAMSVYTIFMTLCSLGLSSYLAAEIARRKDRGTFVASALALVAVSAAVSVFAMAGAGYFATQAPAGRKAILVLSLGLIPTGLIGVAEAVFIALGRTQVIALANTTENLLRSVIPVFLLYRGHTIAEICFSFVLLRLTTCCAYALVARGRLRALREASRPVVMSIVKVAPTFAGVTILAAIHWQIGTVLVNRLSGEAEAAKFGVAGRFLVPVTLLLASYASVLQPVASRLAAQALEDLGRFLSRGLRIVIALGLPLAVGAALLGRDLLVRLFGERYAGSAPSLALLAASVVPFSIVMLAARGLVATGRQRLDLLGNAAAVAVNLISNAVLIPRFGATGAATSQFLSVTAMACVEVGYGTSPLFSMGIWQAMWICRWPLAAMAGVIWQVHRFGFWPALVLGGATYLAGLALIWKRIRPPRRGGGADAGEGPKLRILLLGAHTTKTVGGISTLIHDILHSPLAQKFEFRHIVSQVDQYRRFRKLLLAIGALIRFVANLVLWRPNLVYVHVGGHASLYRKAVFIAVARLAGQRVLTHFHAGNFEYYYAQQGRWGRRFIRWGLGRSHRFIAVSHETAKVMRKVWPSVETAVVPNGVKLELFSSGRAAAAGANGHSNGRSNGRANGHPVRLLFVGKMGCRKGEQDLIHALQQVVRTTPEIRLDMLGQLSDSIESLCRESGLRPYIDQLGPVSLERRIEFFQRADIFVLPTYAEALPIAVLEAMASGLPVVTTPVGGIPELLDDGREGYLVRPGDIDSIADRIARLVRDPEQRRQMGRLAHSRAHQFDLNVVFDQLAAELRGAAAKR